MRDPPPWWSINSIFSHSSPPTFLLVKEHGIRATLDKIQKLLSRQLFFPSLHLRLSVPEVMHTEGCDQAPKDELFFQTGFKDHLGKFARLIKHFTASELSDSNNPSVLIRDHKSSGPLQSGPDLNDHPNSVVRSQFFNCKSQHDLSS